MRTRTCVPGQAFDVNLKVENSGTSSDFPIPPRQVSATQIAQLEDLRTDV